MNKIFQQVLGDLLELFDRGSVLQIGNVQFLHVGQNFLKAFAKSFLKLNLEDL